MNNANFNNYYFKYLKYKHKYLRYKKKLFDDKSFIENDSNSGDNNMISLLWLNKEKGPISQFANGVDLNIKDNIVKTYIRLKNTYRNPHVILVLNFDNILPEDFDYFKFYNIECVDINSFDIFKDFVCLDQIFNPNKYNLNHLEKLPIYVQVDMSKIIIQYEYMVYKGFKYVTFFDIDIKMYEDDLKNVLCSSTRFDFLAKPFPENILDHKTIQILDIFGYLVAGLSTNGFNATSFENSFLMCKNDVETIQAIKEFFIDHVFCNIIYNMYIQNNIVKLISKKRGRTGFIYVQEYIPFFIYLFFLKNLIYIDFVLYQNTDNNNFFCELKNKFLLDVDYTYKYSEYWRKPVIIIKILNFHIFKFFTDKFGFPEGDQQDLFNKSLYSVYFGEEYIPPHKLNLFIDNLTNIVGDFNHSARSTIPIPYKCVGIERSKNVLHTHY